MYDKVQKKEPSPKSPQLSDYARMTRQLGDDLIMAHQLLKQLERLPQTETLEGVRDCCNNILGLKSRFDDIIERQEELAEFPTDCYEFSDNLPDPPDEIDDLKMSLMNCLIILGKNPEIGVEDDREILRSLLEEVVNPSSVISDVSLDSTAA